MMSKLRISLAVLAGLLVFSAMPALAQQHRATFLGNPAHRFANPLKTPEDLRARFRDPRLKPDIASILEQWGWKGDLADLHRAAETAVISEAPIAVGTRMPFMSSRDNYKPVTLRDVLWAGKEPAPAYAFTFVSKGRKYRCVTPKACSNFFVEDLGSFAPALKLDVSAPATAGLCGPFDVKVVVRNSGPAEATRVVVTDTLPAGWKTSDGRTSVRWDVGTLRSGEAREAVLPVTAVEVGRGTVSAKAAAAEGGTVEDSASTEIRAPVIAIECAVPARAVAGRPAKVCLTVRNTGTAAEPRTVVTLPIPEGAVPGATTGGGTAADGRVTWEIEGLAPQDSRELCATFTLEKLGSLTFEASAQGSCAPVVATRCATQFIGVPAVLLEVVDLEDPIEIGKEVVYDIRVLNQGFGALNNVRMVCFLPASQEFVSATGTTPAHLQDRVVTLDPLPVIEPKGTVSWRLVVKAAIADDARFKVELRSDEFETPLHENESTRQY